MQHYFVWLGLGGVPPTIWAFIGGCLFGGFQGWVLSNRYCGSDGRKRNG